MARSDCLHDARKLARLCPVMLADRWRDIVFPAVVESELDRGEASDVVLDTNRDFGQQAALNRLVCGVIKRLSWDHPAELVKTLRIRVVSEHNALELFHGTGNLHLARTRPLQNGQSALIVITTFPQDLVLRVQHAHLSVHLLDLPHQALLSLFHQRGELVPLLLNLVLKKVDATK